VCGAALFSSGPFDFDADRLDSPRKVFHHYGIHTCAEAYLVCVFEVKKAGGPKNEMELQATVIRSVKGARKVGNRFVFRRYFEGAPKEISRRAESMLGGLYYVFLDDVESEIKVDPQSPMALWGNTEDLCKVVEMHKRICESRVTASERQRNHNQAP
jgi:hypothetical protein